MRRSAASLIAILAVAAFGVSMAHADIAAFNTAMKAGDFKAASSEAAATWPTLDKNRDDIEVIAREFGFAAYMAGDYPAALNLAEFAATHAPNAGTPPDFHAISQVLFRLADLKVHPSVTARNQLSAALQDRAALNGMDNISFLGADALVAYDFKAGDWKVARESGELAAKITASGGAAYLSSQRKFELYSGVAEYMATKKPEVYDKFGALLKNVVSDINAAPTDKDAERMVPFYWEVSAWLESLDSHLSTRMLKHGVDGKGAIMSEAEKNQPATAREAKLLDAHDDKGCVRKVTMRPEIKYPESAMYQGLVGAVIVTLDIDDKGHASNLKILAAVPEKAFAKTVIDGVSNLQFLPGDKWDATRCKLAETGHKITFKFAIEL